MPLFALPDIIHDIHNILDLAPTNSRWHFFAFLSTLISLLEQKQLNFTHETRKIYTYEKCMARAHLWIFQDNIKFPELTHPFSNFTAVQHSADPTMLCFHIPPLSVLCSRSGGGEWRWLEVKLWWGLTAQKQCFHYFNLIWLCIGQKNVRALVDFSNYKPTILNDSLRVPSATPPTYSLTL